MNRRRFLATTFGTLAATAVGIPSAPPPTLFGVPISTLADSAVMTPKFYTGTVIISHKAIIDAYNGLLVADRRYR